MRGRVEESKVMIICWDKCSDLNEILHRRGQQPQHSPATRVSPNIMGTRNGDLYVYVFYGESLTSLCVPHNAYFEWN